MKLKAVKKLSNKNILHYCSHHSDALSLRIPLETCLCVESVRLMPILVRHGGVVHGAGVSLRLVIFYMNLA